MDVHILQHVPFEGLGSIEPWLFSHGAKIRYTRFFASDISEVKRDRPDLLIVLGGPMSVNEEDKYPWLRGEKAYIKEAIDDDVAVLGICLGAQLIANVLGSRIRRQEYKEIGWFPVRRIETEDDLFSIPDQITVFHWHGETFDLPAGSQRLAESAACAVQAFRYGRNVLALQFHLETTPAALESMIEHCGDEIVPGPFIQTSEAIRTVPPQTFTSMNQVMDRFLSILTKT